VGNDIRNRTWTTGGGKMGDNSDVDSSKLYTQPEEVSYAYEELSKISQNSQSLRLLEMFTEFTNL
jgi:fructose-bisphosphate aldolase class II